LKLQQYFHAEKAKPRFQLRGREGAFGVDVRKRNSHATTPGSPLASPGLVGFMVPVDTGDRAGRQRCLAAVGSSIRRNHFPGSTKSA
jgi:hypothetical protein